MIDSPWPWLHANLTNTLHSNHYYHNKVGVYYPPIILKVRIRRPYTTTPYKASKTQKLPPIYRTHKLMESFSQTTIRYLTHIILNKHKLEKKQSPSSTALKPPPPLVPHYPLVHLLRIGIEPSSYLLPTQARMGNGEWTSRIKCNQTLTFVLVIMCYVVLAILLVIVCMSLHYIGQCSTQVLLMHINHRFTNARQVLLCKSNW